MLLVLLVVPRIFVQSTVLRLAFHWFLSMARVCHTRIGSITIFWISSFGATFCQFTRKIAPREALHLWGNNALSRCFLHLVQYMLIYLQKEFDHLNLNRLLDYYQLLASVGDWHVIKDSQAIFLAGGRYFPWRTGRAKRTSEAVHRSQSNNPPTDADKND